MRPPLQRVGFPPVRGACGEGGKHSSSGGSLSCSLLTQAPALEKPLPGAWRHALAASAWTLEVGQLRPLWGARLSHWGKEGGLHMFSLPPPPPSPLQELPAEP